MQEEKEGDGKRRRTIAREGVGDGEREEEREEDTLPPNQKFWLRPCISFKSTDWRFGLVAIALRLRISTQIRRARLVLKWLTVRRYIFLVFNQTNSAWPSLDR